jgi:hypothetical protein
MACFNMVVVDSDSANDDDLALLGAAAAAVEVLPRVCREPNLDFASFSWAVEIIPPLRVDARGAAAESAPVPAPAEVLRIAWLFDGDEAAVALSSSAAPALRRFFRPRAPAIRAAGSTPGRLLLLRVGPSPPSCLWQL